MRVAVIGAGPGGLAAAKYLHAEKAFSNVTIFEQRNEAGGVWCYTPEIDDSFAVPHTKPATTPEKPILSKEASGGITFQSPVYDLLETNIPHNLMNYSDWKFPADSPLFPPHQTVKEYVQGYAKDVLSSILFNTQVVDVRPLDKSAGSSSGWKVTVLDLQTKQESTHEFDAVVVANGHYNDHYIPEISGIQEWSRAYPDSISHSKYYRRPCQFSNKKVVIVGNSASGVDVSAQVASVAQRPVLVSERNESPPAFINNNPNVKSLPEIAEFILENRTLRFSNGHIEHNVDHVLFCTGYLYSFPFLSSLTPPAVTADGSRPDKLFQHLFYYPDPTLTFIGLPLRVVPFPLSEAQGAVVARVYSGRLRLPPLEKMKAWEDDWIAKHGAGKSFNILGYPPDADYLNHLSTWSLQAARKSGLSNDGQGKIPPIWKGKDLWVRKLAFMFKAAAQALGEKRKSIKSLEELGFSYENDIKSKI